MSNAVCRACLTSNVKMYRISNDLRELYEKVTNEKLPQNDKPVLCYICCTVFEKSYKFIKMAQESNRILTRNAGFVASNIEFPMKLSMSKVSHTNISDDLMSISKVEIKTELDLEVIDTENKQTTDLTDELPSIIDTKNDSDSNEVTKDDIDIIENAGIKVDASSDDEPLIKVKKKRKKRIMYEESSKKLKLPKKPIAIYLTKDSTDFDVKTETDSPKNKTPGPKVLCHICKRQISKVGFKTHLRIHAGDKIYSCSFCDYKCVRKYSLDIHNRRHSGQKPFSCDLCQYKSSIKKNLQRHLLVHSGVKPFSCTICGQTFTQKVSLDSHRLRIHTSENPYPCNICGHRFIRKQELEKHKQVHLYGRKQKQSTMTNFPKNMPTDQQYLCHYCDYFCKKKSVLKTHLMSHTGEKPYSCDKCDFKTTSKPTLKTHMRRHTGEKPFLCHFCDYRCAQKSNLNNHIRIHTGEKAYACDLCEYRSTQLPHLKQHKKIHTGEKSFLCLLCNYKCNYKQRLQKHIMSVHRREAKQELAH